MNESRFPLFRGSSLTRKKNDNKASKETEEILLQFDVESEGKSFIDLSGYDVESMSLSEFRQYVSSMEPRSPSNRVADYGIRKRKKSEGKMHRLSHRSKQKIREKIFALYQTDSDAFTFLTLTFINKVDDTKASKILNKFLTVLRSEFGRFLYLWVAERQQNGNIHFHFITNRRFPVRRLNSLWVLQQYNAGVTHEKYDISNIVERHSLGTMQKILNPVDITEIKSIEALSGYLTGYITKNEAEFSCLSWHCCRGVSALFTAQIVHEKVVNEVNDKTINMAISKKGKKYECKTYTATNKDTGKEVAIVTNIVNKEYFKKYLYQMDGLNRLMISDYLEKKKVNEILVLDPNKFFEFYYQQINLN